jgi:hypothetical protein
VCSTRPTGFPCAREPSSPWPDPAHRPRQSTHRIDCPASLPPSFLAPRDFPLPSLAHRLTLKTSLAPPPPSASALALLYIYAHRPVHPLPCLYAPAGSCVALDSQHTPVMDSGSSSASAPSSSLSCRLDAVRRCVATAARAAGWALGVLLTCVFAVGTRSFPSPPWMLFFVE